MIQMTTPEDVLRGIETGKLDAMLDDLTATLRARRKLLSSRKAAETLASLEIGDHIELGNGVRPLKLNGATGVIVKINVKRAVVSLDPGQGLGKWELGTIRVPASLIKKSVE
jgi:hypothetical protein